MAALRDNAHFDVAVIGFGPAGAVAAALLGQVGITTLVVDKQHDIYPKPRAIALDHEIMRVFQQLGLADRITAHCEPFTPSEYYGADGRLIKRLATVEPPYPLGHVPSMVFSQPAVEQELRAYVATLPKVRVELGLQCDLLEQDEQRVLVGLRDGQGARRTVSASYVIGCDGASSTVRDLAGLVLDDLDFDEPWLVVDVLVNQQGLARLPATSVQYCEPARPCTYVIGPGNHRRWEISLLPGEDPAYMATPEGAWQVLSRWITPDDAQLWRQASYRFHALVADRWRNGRVFIAGDAAHQQPPFLGQGMCQGVRDVTNLAWKLRAVLAGDAGDTLLDTYGTERGRHVRRLTTRIKEIGAVICERDPAAARARDEALIAAAGGTIKTMARQDIIPPLETGLLSVYPHAANGTLFPQPRLTTAGQPLMDDAIGYGWRVVSRQSPAALAANAATGITVLSIAPDGDVHPDVHAYAECDGVLARWFERHGCDAALVRPDHYVYGVSSGRAELAALLQSWRGALLH
jgi:3-(3-hydroxy-phenyl)propionate hydroxylase